MSAAARTHVSLVTDKGRGDSTMQANHVFAAPAARQRSEQKRTLSQSRAHFLRHANGRPHAAQGFEGRLALAVLTPLAVFRVRPPMGVSP